MAEHADALVGYQTYPHIDQRGDRADRRRADGADGPKGDPTA